MIQNWQNRATIPCGQRASVDQQGKLTTPWFRLRRRAWLTRQATYPHPEAPRDGGYWRVRAQQHVFATDIHVMYQVTVLDVEAVSGGSIPVGNEYPRGAIDKPHLGLDEVAAAAHIRCYFGRHVPHASMEDIALTGAVKAASVLDKALSKAIIQRQHLVLLCFLPPQLDHGGELVRLLRRQVVGFRKILREVEQLPRICIIGRSRGMIRDRLPARDATTPR